MSFCDSQIFSEPQSTSPGKKVTTTVSSHPTLGQVPKPSYQNMEYKRPLIGTNEPEDIEMAAKRVTAYNASLEYKPKSENKNHIKRSTRQQTGFVITIISITIWVLFIKKTGTAINTTAATIDLSTTGTTMFTASITKIAVITTSTTESTINTTTTTISASTTETTMFTTSATETAMLITSTNSHTTTKNVSGFNKWKQNAITVAGGNGQGQQVNQLNGPEGIFIDKNKNIFIADFYNHRIVEWKYNAKEGQIIAGGNGRGDQIDQMNYTTDVIIDQQNHSIIIADRGNKRVIQWLNQNQQILIENISCYGLAMDKHGFLYVSDQGKHEVRRWKMGEYIEGMVVAGGNKQGDQLNQLSYPDFIFVGEDQSVYVSDRSNNRVMKWRKGAKEGTVVAGGNGFGRNLNQFFEPEGIAVDHLGQIYVADSGNDRVMRWREGKEEGEIIVGGNRRGNQLNQLNLPKGLSFDDEGNLYVVDYGNDRIVKFEIIF
ncbi:unnamed protein product [Adineta steineri]|uniref:Uncharacterized protein n=1 Tax=Adineta steineri TaxID=433720 RepID=A0A815MDK6_9BILA|nr:unnamed protein product [Adineta steineri]CAF1621659.1 unnamed protein product [Adineta steineri]